MESNKLGNKELNILGKHNKLKGSFLFKGLTRIACKIEGDIEHRALNEKDSTLEPLILERESEVIGDISGEYIEVFGKYQGNITGRSRVILHSGSHCKGIINSKDLVIYPGANVEIEGHTEDFLN